SAEKRAVRKSADFLRLRFPDLQSASDPELEALVVRSRRTARGIGFRREDNLRVFASLSVAFGEEFHREPWADILHVQALFPPDRMSALRQYLSARNMEF